MSFNQQRDRFFKLSQPFALDATKELALLPDEIGNLTLKQARLIRLQESEALHKSMKDYLLIDMVSSPYSTAILDSAIL
jgi:hypothetical protein